MKKAATLLALVLGTAFGSSVASADEPAAAIDNEASVSVGDGDHGVGRLARCWFGGSTLVQWRLSGHGDPDACRAPSALENTYPTMPRARVTPDGGIRYVSRPAVRAPHRTAPTPRPRLEATTRRPH